MAGTSVDMMLIAVDASFQTRVKALTFQYCIQTIGGNTAQSAARKAYAAQVLNNPNGLINNFVWACAQNQAVADAVVAANGGVNFTPTSTAASVAAAVTTSTPLSTGATDTLIGNAIAASFNVLANA